MFTIHFDSSREELNAIKIGDVVGYGCGFASKVVKLTKENTNGTFYYVFYFENGDTKPVTVLKYLSTIKK